MFSNPPPKAPAPLSEERKAEIKRLKEDHMKKRQAEIVRHGIFMADLKAKDPLSAEKLESMIAEASIDSKAGHAIKAVLGGSK